MEIDRGGKRVGYACDRVTYRHIINTFFVRFELDAFLSAHRVVL